MNMLFFLVTNQEQIIYIAIYIVLVWLVVIGKKHCQYFLVIVKPFTIETLQDRGKLPKSSR